MSEVMTMDYFNSGDLGLANGGSLTLLVDDDTQITQNATIVQINYANKLKNTQETLVIPPILHGEHGTYRIIGLSANCFSNFKCLKTICFSPELTWEGSGFFIGDNCFGYCDNLKYLHIECQLDIQEKAFSGCTSLMSVDVHNRWDSIESNAFESCYRLVEVFDLANIGITAGETTHGGIGSYARVVHTDLVESNIFESENYLYYFDTYDDDGVLVDHILVGPDNLEDTAIDIDDDCTEINSWALSGMPSLTSCYIPQGVRNIGQHILAYTPKIVTLSVPFIGPENMDLYNGNLGYFFLSENEKAQNPDTTKYVTISQTYGAPSQESQTKNKNFYIPGDLRTVIVKNEQSGYVPWGAFYNCSMLTSITLLGYSDTIMQDAFYGCTGLKTLGLSTNFRNITNMVTCLAPSKVVNTLLLYGNAGGSEILGKIYYWRVQSDDTDIELWTDVINALGVSSLVFGDDSVTKQGCTLGKYTFKKLTNIVNIHFRGSTPDATDVQALSFGDCPELKTISMDATVRNFGTTINAINDIFLSPFRVNSGDPTPKLANITVYGANSTYESPYGINAIIEKSTHKLIFGCKNTTIPISVLSIGSNAFYSCEGLTEILIPDNVTTIGQAAFSHCTGLESIVLPANLTDLPANIFETCTSLESVDLPEGLLRIGNYAFTECSSLKQITLPQSLIEIVEEAFCTSGLETITIPNGITTINSCTFESCENLKVVRLPNTLKTIDSGAFYRCYSLKSLDLPDSLTTINYEAFYHSGLQKVSLGKNLNTIGENVFTGCADLTGITFRLSPEDLARKIKELDPEGTNQWRLKSADSNETAHHYAVYAQWQAPVLAATAKRAIEADKAHSDEKGNSFSTQYVRSDKVHVSAPFEYDSSSGYFVLNTSSIPSTIFGNSDTVYITLEFGFNNGNYADYTVINTLMSHSNSMYAGGNVVACLVNKTWYQFVIRLNGSNIEAWPMFELAESTDGNDADKWSINFIGLCNLANLNINVW